MMRKQVWAVVAVALVILSSGMVACSTNKPMGNVDQAGIEANIRSQIASHYPGETFDIHIDVTEQGVVTLGGTVDNGDKRTRIGEIATGTPGVTRVINNIAVKS